MHTVFAVSAVLMLLGTVWMMGDDNDRPWKDYQRKFNSLDLWATDARITEQKSTDYLNELEKKEKAVNAAQGISRQPIAPRPTNSPAWTNSSPTRWLGSLKKRIAISRSLASRQPTIKS